MRYHIFLIGLLFSVNGISSRLVVKHKILSTLYLPYTYDPTPTYGLGEDAAEQLAYDKDSKIVYSVGKLKTIYEFFPLIIGVSYVK